MTFTAIQDEVKDRLNLSSATAVARIGRSINERYRWIATAIGLQAIARVTITTNTTIGNRSVVFPGSTKLYSVFDPMPSPIRRLTERSYDPLRNSTVGTDPAADYAVQLMGATSVTIFLSCVPASVYPLQADAEAALLDLAGTDVPNFCQDYHDVLIYGAMVTELEKMEKYDLAKVQEGRYDQRKAELIAFMGLRR